ncbi:GNAT family N-acetyltransferase, partial [Geobacillus thermodenitrificans]|uniref:GNAT family N-acetyltransferase n=1 Tax=Geobacillus thermodenitrificans TaxID=33940 RepID=UPI003D1D72C1
ILDGTGEKDGIPIPNSERVNEVRNLFLKEREENNLRFRVAVDEQGNIVACAGGLIRMEYATPLSEEPTPFGWVISVYTIPHHRKKGLASQLVEEVCSWLKERGARRARLWASSEGRRIYERLGFSPMLDMEKAL